MTTKISEYIRGWNKMKKRSFIYFCEFMGGGGLLLNFSRKIFCKNYNEVLTHWGYEIWRIYGRERRAVEERRVGIV
jgi:hypothetical protein